MYRRRNAEKKKKKKVLSRLCFFLGVVYVLLSFGERKQAEKKEKYLVVLQSSVCRLLFVLI